MMRQVFPDEEFLASPPPTMDHAAVSDSHPGVRIRQLREKLGLSQAQLAKRAGLAREHISAIERGKNKVTGAAAREGLARALGMTAEDFARDVLGQDFEVETALREAFDELRRSFLGRKGTSAERFARLRSRLVELRGRNPQVDQLLDRLLGDETPRTAAPTNDPYPSRSQCLALLGDLYPPNVVAAVQREILPDGNDPGFDHWRDRLRHFDKVFQEERRSLDGGRE